MFWLGYWLIWLAIKTDIITVIMWILLHWLPALKVICNCYASIAFSDSAPFISLSIECNIPPTTFIANVQEIRYVYQLCMHVAILCKSLNDFM